MGTFYKGIEYVSNPTERVVYHKNQTFQHTAEGINSIPFRSESLNFEDSGVGLISHTISGSHYNFVKYFLNDSSSFDGYSKLNKNKLHSSGSVIYIPQQYFGEKVKPKSFTLTDNSTTKEVLIQDDGDGNLYSPNSHVSKSTNNASHSDNYVGNIHYETGVVVLADTSSWSGSSYSSSDGINYTDLGKNFKVDFNSTTTITQNELILTIKSTDFNATANQTLFKNTDSGKTSQILDTISSSIEEFGPYATTIAFYNQVPSVLYTKEVESSQYLGPYVIPANTPTEIVWNEPTIAVGEAGIPVNPGVQSIVGTGVACTYNPTLGWVGSLDDLIQNERYVFTSNVDVNFGDSALYGTEFYTPENKAVMVAKFPRPVKIRKNSDLKIIIRYDT
jgi:hypothetical protein